MDVVAVAVVVDAVVKGELVVEDAVEEAAEYDDVVVAGDAVVVAVVVAMRTQVQSRAGTEV